MAFRDTVLQFSEQLATRPVFKQLVLDTIELKETASLETPSTSMKKTIEVPRMTKNDVKTKDGSNKPRRARYEYRTALWAMFHTMSQEEQRKLSALVRAARNKQPVLDVFANTRHNDRIALSARHDELLAGLELAEKQGVSLDADWAEAVAKR